MKKSILAIVLVFGFSFNAQAGLPCMPWHWGNIDEYEVQELDITYIPWHWDDVIEVSLKAKEKSIPWHWDDV